MPPPGMGGWTPQQPFPRPPPGPLPGGPPPPGWVPYQPNPLPLPGQQHPGLGGMGLMPPHLMAMMPPGMAGMQLPPQLGMPPMMRPPLGPLPPGQLFTPAVPPPLTARQPPRAPAGAQPRPPRTSMHGRAQSAGPRPPAHSRPQSATASPHGGGSPPPVPRSLTMLPPSPSKAGLPRRSGSAGRGLRTSLHHPAQGLAQQLDALPGGPPSPQRVSSAAPSRAGSARAPSLAGTALDDGDNIKARILCIQSWRTAEYTIHSLPPSRSSLCCRCAQASPVCEIFIVWCRWPSACVP
jgi:hypothetical protein